MALRALLADVREVQLDGATVPAVVDGHEVLPLHLLLHYLFIRRRVPQHSVNHLHT